MRKGICLAALLLSMPARGADVFYPWPVKDPQPPGSVVEPIVAGEDSKTDLAPGQVPEEE